MIKFFRKIRQKLLEQNRVSKYLLYAIGEILLVVIGILIALQLNILKEDADDKRATQQLLLGIQADLELEAQRIDFLIAFYSNITNGIQQIILAHQGKAELSNEDTGKYLLNAFEIRKFSRFNTSYQTLYVSGFLQKIEDKALSEQIVTYYTKQFLEWSLEAYHQKAYSFDFSRTPEFEPLDKLRRLDSYNLIPDFELETQQTFSTDFKALANHPKVLNYLLDVLYQSKFVFGNLNDFKVSNKALSEAIKNYLEQ